jgi:hypothetical protein
MATTNNIVCLRHPKYDGQSSPDLTCKTCCSKFVARIRTEQQSQFEPTWNAQSSSISSGFQLIKPTAVDAEKTSAKRQANFDGSWI